MEEQWRSGRVLAALPSQAAPAWRIMPAAKSQAAPCLARAEGCNTLPKGSAAAMHGCLTTQSPQSRLLGVGEDFGDSTT